MASPPQQQLASSRPNDAPSQEPVAKSVVVPRCSTWFAMEAINPIEKRMLPEFFVNEALYRNFPPGAKGSSSKTPQIYMKYRNFMINAYRQQPHVYLTATACRRNLAGDACAILRVHEFLTHWGLINYSVPPHAMPPAIHANYALKPAVNPSSTASGPIAVLHDAKTTQSGNSGAQRRNWKCEACGLGEVAFELSAESKRKVTEANGNASNGNAAITKEMALSVFCLAPGSGLCDECFLHRPAVFPDGVDASDFVRVEAPAQWTQEETKLLLETVATSGRDSDESCDWNVIAAKLRTKTAEDCMLHFLELPILQQAGQVSHLGLNGEANNANAADVLQRPFEYAQAMNASVIDMSALVAQVDPFVAKAAARAAIRAVQQLHTMPATTVTSSAPASGAVKSEAASSSQSAATENGDDAVNGSSLLEQAAAAVASSAEAAGIAVKAESGAGGDVEMKSVSDSQMPNSSNSASLLLTKEVVAVAKEASGATAAALLAVRAHSIAEATAKGPVRDLVTELLQNQLQQMELKMQQLSVLENAVVAEREKLTQEKYQLYVDRLAFAQEKLGDGGAATSSANAL